jgi:hypothetical protein
LFRRESESLLGQLVDVGGSDFGVAVTARIIPCQIIGQEQKDVRPSGCVGKGRLGDEKQACSKRCGLQDVTKCKHDFSFLHDGR